MSTAHEIPRLNRAAFLLLPLLAACGDAAAGDSAGGVVVRDSAGIEIVENAAQSWGEAEGWRLSTEPLLQIGRAEGDAEYLLDRVTGARRLPDGRLLIPNGGSGELRYYAADGTHLRSVGGQGEGPGEFRNIDWVRPYRGDSLIVHDRSLRRATILSTEGEFGRVISLSSPGEGTPPIPEGAFGDGTLLGRLTVLVGPDEIRTGMRSSDAMYATFAAADGAFIDSLATIPGSERHLLAEPQMVMITTPLLSPEPHVTVAGDRAFIGHGGTFEVREFSTDGMLHRLIRTSAPAVLVTDADLDRLVEERLAGIEMEEARRRSAEVYALMPRPEARPAFTALMADDAGNLWVQQSRLPWESGMWYVFDSSGRLLGPVEMPSGFEPSHIGEDFVVGVVTDELGVQRVRVYGIEKGAP